MPEIDPLDRLLDAALHSYADPGPGAGLEQRILRTVAQQAAAKAHRSWGSPLRWAAGSSFAAAALLLVFVLLPGPKVTSPAPPPRAAIARHAPQTLATTTSPPAKPVHHRERPAVAVASQPTAAPKLAVFPTPTPLSPQERALVGLVTGASIERRKDLIAAQQQGDTPLRIAAISIPSIEPPQEGKEKQ
jgi:hypothetical protein